MNENRIMEQISAIFSAFMALFYLAVGWFFVFYSDLSYIDKPVRVIAGVSFLFYGLYRVFRAYFKIIEVFFSKNNNSD